MNIVSIRIVQYVKYVRIRDTSLAWHNSDGYTSHTHTHKVLFGFVCECVCVKLEGQWKLCKWSYANSPRWVGNSTNGEQRLDRSFLRAASDGTDTPPTVFNYWGRHVDRLEALYLVREKVARPITLISWVYCKVQIEIWEACSFFFFSFLKNLAYVTFVNWWFFSS